ncbi:hypothetical protein Tco_0996893 [Tanacetum coccineum]
MERGDFGTNGMGKIMGTNDVWALGYEAYAGAGTKADLQTFESIEYTWAEHERKLAIHKYPICIHRNMSRTTLLRRCPRQGYNPLAVASPPSVPALAPVHSLASVSDQAYVGAIWSHEQVEDKYNNQKIPAYLKQSSGPNSQSQGLELPIGESCEDGPV